MLCIIPINISCSETILDISIISKKRVQKGMRIYAVADIHGKPAKIARIRQVILELKPDALVVAGDITGYVNSNAVISQLNHMPAPVLAIRGNTDLEKVDRLLDYYPNTSSLHLREQKINGLKFVGVSGTIPVPFRSRIGWCEKRVINTLAAQVDDTSVLVVHSPPGGYWMKHSGGFTLDADACINW